MENSNSTSKYPLKKLIPLRRPPLGGGGEKAVKDVNIGGDQSDDYESSLSPAGANAYVDEAKTNGGDADTRMAEIELILDHAAMHLLEKCALVAEWIHHAEASVSVFGHFDQKAQGGRPEGGVARAARALPVPGKTTEARRKFIERALKIDGIWPEAKSAARAAGFDDVQKALLDVAAERSPEAQLAKVREIAARKATPRRKSSVRESDELAASREAQSGTAGDRHTQGTNALPAPTNETLAIEQEPQPATLKALASDEQSEAPSHSAIDGAKPASNAVLINFAKFILAHISQGEKIALTLTASEEVKEFNRLANRVRLVLGQQG
jgi:hypothetical protein